MYCTLLPRILLTQYGTKGGKWDKMKHTTKKITKGVLIKQTIAIFTVTLTSLSRMVRRMT